MSAAQSGPARASPVAELFERGRSANVGGRPAEGERLLRRALRLLASADQDLPVAGFASLGGGEATPPEATARVLLSLSTSLVQRRGAEPAVESAARALALAQDGIVPDPVVRAELVAKCRLQQAMIAGQTGHLDEAMHHLDLALQSVDHLGPRDRYHLLLARGAVRCDGADPAQAEEDFVAAAELAHEQGMPQQEFMARHNLAQVALLRGDLPRALRLHQDLERLGVDASAAVAQHGRAIVLLQAGLMTEAVDLLVRAAAQAERSGERLLAGDIQVDLALAHLALSEPDEARRVAGRARRILVRREAPGMYRRAELALLQARLQRGHRLGEVAARARQLASEFAGDGDQVAADLGHLLAAEVETARGQPAAALEQLRQLSELTQVGSLITRMRARKVLAEAARAHDDVTTARRHLRAALLDLVEAVGASASLEVRGATHLHAEGLARLDLELADGIPRDTLLALERWRQAASMTPSVRPPEDQELARRVAVLRHLHQQVRDEPGRANALRPRLRELERSVATLSWSAPGRSGVREAVTRRSVSRALHTVAAHDATLVYLAEHAGRLVAVVGRGSRCSQVDLGPSLPIREVGQRLVIDLQTCARAYGGPMEDRVRASLERSSGRFDDLVLAPLGIDGRVLVVPSPELAPVPWGLLPSRQGLPTPVAPSLTTWSERPLTVRQPVVRALSGPGLLRADEEVEAVAAAWPQGSSHPGAEGDDLAESLRVADVVHVAAHGQHRDDSPLFSSLDLIDGPYFLAHLERSSLRASQVVLSACDSGRARCRGGPATLGLAAGLLALGVGSVVAAPCRIPDEVAAEHMPRYHGLLARGVPADEAVARAAVGAHPLAGAFIAWGAPWRAGPDGRAG